MARIQEVQEPSVRPEAMQTPYQRPFATPQGQGAGFGDVLEQGAAVGNQFAQDARHKANAAQVQGAAGAGQDLLNKTILDPEKGYLSLRGDDAIKAREKVLGDYSKGLAQINQGLTPDQQTMFAPHLRSLQEQGVTHAIGHETVEMERYAQANFKGNVDATMETMQAPSVVTDPLEIQKNVAKLYQAGIDEARRKYGQGASKDAIAAVVTPVLQETALGGMQAALVQAEQAGDPSIAKGAFAVLGKYLIKTHQKQIGGMVDALTAKAAIQAGAQGIVNSSVTHTMVPGGDPIAVVDGTKYAAAVAALPENTPHRDEIVKAAEQSRKRLDDAKDATVGTVVQRILKAGDPQAIGDFRLDRPGVSIVDRQWLRDVDDKKLIGLRDMQDREALKGKRDADQNSVRNYNDLITRMRDETQRRTVWGPMAPDQFRAALLDGDQFPGGFSDKQTTAALRAFNTLKNEVGKPQEPVQSAVSEIIKGAFKNNPNAAKDYIGPIHDEVVHFIDSEKQKHNGVAPDLAAVRAHGLEELAKGAVTDPGKTPGIFDFNSTRRIDFERDPKYVGRQFNPQGGADPFVRGAGALAPLPVQAATPVTPARAPPTGMPDAVHITNGKQSGWLPAGKAMPAGWKAD